MSKNFLSRTQVSVCVCVCVCVHVCVCEHMCVCACVRVWHHLVYALMISLQTSEINEGKNSTEPDFFVARQLLTFPFKYVLQFQEVLVHVPIRDRCSDLCVGIDMVKNNHYCLQKWYGRCSAKKGLMPAYPVYNSHQIEALP